MRWIVGVSCVAAMLCATRAWAGPKVDEDGYFTEPVLRIENGMHTDIIRSIAADRSGRWIATTSEDGTIRVWSGRSGELVEVLRTPLGRDPVGRIYAVAISPDGEEIVAGGWLTGAPKQCLLVFHRGGALARRICGLRGSTDSLAISRDGRRLAAAIADHGVQLFELATGRVISTEDYGSRTFGLSFAPDGRFVTASYDGRVRLFDPEGKLLKARTLEAGAPALMGAAYSSDGLQIAVGMKEAANEVRLLKASDLSDVRRLVLGASSMGLKVAWSATGARLFAGGASRQVFVWDGAPSQARIHPASDELIMSLAPLGEEGLAFAAANAWGDLRGDELELQKKVNVIDMRASVLRTSSDGASISFSEPYGAAFSFSVKTCVLMAPPKASEGKAPRQLSAKLEISGWKDQAAPKLGGAPIELAQYETSRSLSVAPDDASFVLGTEWYLRAFTSTGKQLWAVDTPTAWAVNHSGDGSLVVAALNDGTIRWYRARDGVELLALYVHPDLKRWIVWTPSGYYDASPGAEDLLGWHVNRGADQAPDFFPASRFRDRYYRPDIVSRVLDLHDEAAAVAKADAARPIPVATVPWDRMQPPAVRILSPEPETAVGKPEVELAVSIRSPSKEPITEVLTIVDGRPVSARKASLGSTKEPPADGEDIRNLTVPVPPRPCTVSVIARTKYATSEAAAIQLTWIGGAPAEREPLKGPTAIAYVLAIGVKNYENNSLSLGFPDSDAESFAKAWKRQEGGLYAKVITRVLTNDAAKKNAILDGLEWLQRSTSQKDVAILLLAGHGENDFATNVYHFLPYDADASAVKRTYLPKHELFTTTDSIAGKVLVFLDTCHAGAAAREIAGRDARDLTPLINELASAEHGAVVYSAATGRQLSQESKKWGGGAFSMAVVDCLGGAKIADARGGVSTTRLATCIDERVRAMTEGTQKPVFDPGHVPEFPVAVLPPPAQP